jgi:hypothetical protein
VPGDVVIELNGVSTTGQAVAECKTTSLFDRMRRTSIAFRYFS